MAQDVQNYTLGRGKVYFSRFRTGTTTPSGFFYIGNTPEFNLTIESENLDHFSSDEGIREKDDSVPLEVNRTGSMITDNIVPRNVALFFFGSDSTVTQLSASAQEEDIADVIAGHSYKLGASDTNPAGYFGLDPVGFTVKPDGVSLVAAQGSLLFTGVGTDGDTFTIGETTYTLRTTPTAPYEIDIAGTAALTAANVVAAINDAGVEGTTYGTGTIVHQEVSASLSTATVNLTALEGGTPGNSLTLTESSSAITPTVFSGGTGAAYTEGTDYEVDYNSGMITLLSDGTITTGTDITVNFAVRASTRSRIISGSEPVEGQMQYIAHNPKGDNFNYFLPWVKITPNGDYALKGDEWQQIPFNIEALKPVGAEAIYMDGVPAYV